MDTTLTNYRQIIVEVLTHHASLPATNRPGDEAEEQLILDTERDHYQILTIGWEQGKRVYCPVFHPAYKRAMGEYAVA